MVGMRSLLPRNVRERPVMTAMKVTMEETASKNRWGEGDGSGEGDGIVGGRQSRQRQRLSSAMLVQRINGFGYAQTREESELCSQPVSILSDRILVLCRHLSPTTKGSSDSVIGYLSVAYCQRSNPLLP